MSNKSLPFGEVRILYKGGSPVLWAQVDDYEFTLRIENFKDLYEQMQGSNVPADIRRTYQLDTLDQLLESVKQVKTTQPLQSRQEVHVLTFDQYTINNLAGDVNAFLIIGWSLRQIVNLDGHSGYKVMAILERSVAS